MRDFIITTLDKEYPGFSYIGVTDTIRLWYSNDVRLAIIESKKGTIYYLLGTAIQTIAGASSPVDILREENFTDIEQVLSSWSGRYALVTGRFVYNDALCLMRLFYWKSNTNFCISNSIRLINEYAGQRKQRDSYTPSSIKFGSGIDYFPGPATIYEDIFSVMFNQYMELSELGGVNLKMFRPQSFGFEQKTTKQLTELLDSHFSTYLANISHTFRHILIPLSGGWDSRTVVSYALKNGIKFGCYTCDKKDIAEYDKKLPKQICKKFNIPWQYIRKPHISERELTNRYKEFDNQTSNLVIDRDREYYAYKQIPNLKDTVVLGSVWWDLFHVGYENMVNERINFANQAAIIFSKWSPSSFVTELLDEYLKYLKVNYSLESDYIPFPDRFYLEQRIGCWLSGIEQSWDLYDTVRLQPVDSRFFVELFLTIQKRNVKEFQRKIILNNAPELLEYPVNWIMPTLYKRIRNKLKRIL